MNIPQRPKYDEIPREAMRFSRGGHCDHEIFSWRGGHIMATRISCQSQENLVAIMYNPTPRENLVDTILKHVNIGEIKGLVSVFR